MRLSLYHILLVFFISFIYSCSTPNKNKVEIIESVFLCNVEEIDVEENKFVEASKKDIYFDNTDRQSNDFSHSGNYSCKLYFGKPYGLTTDIQNVLPNEYIEVTVWRKSENEGGAVIFDGGKGLYVAGKHIVERGADGWCKIFAECHIPPNFFNNKIKIYVYNNETDTVYFDDLQIIHKNKKVYPEYNERNTLQIHTNESDLYKFEQKRLQAFETTILANSDEDYSDVVLFDGNDFLNGSFRLKGDLVDHLQGQKWSFRIKLKKDFTWNHMYTFSIQNPSTRNFLHEWLAHKVFAHEDVLTTRYGFVPVKMNNESLGIYAWEEHFEKQLIENQNRREGPIVRFDESLMWQRISITVQTERDWDIDYFQAAKIIPFKEKRTVEDSTLNMQFTEAQKLLLQYQNRTKPASLIFDIDKLAKYYALIDLTQAYHGFTWHNQRFYYNPVTCLLEPIAFDGYIENGVFKRIDERLTGLLESQKIATFNKEQLMMFQVFTDKNFRKKYLKNLQTYSTPDFLNSLVDEYQVQADSLSLMIRNEFPYYHFSFNELKSQANYIQNNLEKIQINSEKIGSAISLIKSDSFIKEYTSNVNKDLIPFQIHAFYNKKEERIDLLNFHNAKVRPLGVFTEGGIPEKFEDEPELEEYKGVIVPHIFLPVKGIPKTVLFEVNGEQYETEVSPWAFTNENTFRQITMQNKLPKNVQVDGNFVVFDGIYRFNSDVVIPDSFQVIAKPGTQIDLVDGASFICFAPIQFLGTETKPIQIQSSDNSANGFNILQPEGKSVLKNVHFSGLSSLQKAGWQTPAAITFYEAEVELENCIFANNFNCDDALNIVRSEFAVTNCFFENTFADAFDSDFCRGIVQNCTFKNIGNDAIDFSGSKVKIDNCSMFEISDKAISGGENSKLIISNCEIDKANIGVAAKDLSGLKIDKITMNKTVYGIVAFRKKTEYGPANITIDNLEMKNNIIFHQIEVGSSLTLNGKLIEGREKKLAIKLYQ